MMRWSVRVGPGRVLRCDVGSTWWSGPKADLISGRGREPRSLARPTRPTFTADSRSAPPSPHNHRADQIRPRRFCHKNTKCHHASHQPDLPEQSQSWLLTLTLSRSGNDPAPGHARVRGAGGPHRAG